MKTNAIYGLARYGFAIYGYPLGSISQTPPFIDPGAGGGHRKRVKGPKLQPLVNVPIEGRSKYDGIEDLLKKQFLRPEERVILVTEVKRAISTPINPIVHRTQSPKRFTLGDNEELRGKLESLRASLAEVRNEYDEEDAIALLLLST